MVRLGGKNESLMATSCNIWSTIPPFQIILMSATINCGQFAEYYATMIWGKLNPAYVFEVEGAPYAIEEFYLDDLHKLFPFRVRRKKILTPIYCFFVLKSHNNFFVSSSGWVASYWWPSHFCGDVQSCHQSYPVLWWVRRQRIRVGPQYYSTHDCFSISLTHKKKNLVHSYFSSKADKGAGGLTSSECGSVLVFLPGIYEIRYMQEALSKLFHKRWALQFLSSLKFLCS